MAAKSARARELAAARADVRRIEAELAAVLADLDALETSRQGQESTP